MKKKERSFMPYLVVFLLILQLANKLTPQDTYLQTDDSLKVINNSYMNGENTRLTLVNELSNKLEPELSVTLNSSDNYKVSSFRKCSESLSSLYYQATVSENAKDLTKHLPDSFQYKVVNEEALKGYLQTRSSLLMTEPYFSSIINVGRDFNINPILLFAITGQEQGFVPQNQVSAAQIANNPYNVFCSWEDYNTDIIDSSEIACRTIINLSKDKPDSVDTLVWINRKYSADQNWNNGVKTLYDDINKFIANYNY